MLWASGKVSEFTIEYTGCEFSAPNTTFANIPSDKYSYHMSGSDSTPVVAPQWQYLQDTSVANVAQQRRCTIQFTVPKELDHSVFMYYKLTNYFQNHRRYVQSYNSDQFKGDPKTASDLHSAGECKPLDQINNIPVYPCGLIANSLFNGMLIWMEADILADIKTDFAPISDTFGLPTLIEAAGSTTAVSAPYNMTDSGITWSGESRKYSPTRYQLGEAVPPPFWALRYPNGYTAETPYPDLSTDEHFQVWMRTAGLPTFRKLYYRNDNENMAAGRYSIDIFLSELIVLYTIDMKSTFPDCLIDIPPRTLRLSCCAIWRHESYRIQHRFIYWWPQSLPRNRIPRRRGHLRSAWSSSNP